MKTRLLRRVRKRIKFREFSDRYLIEKGGLTREFKNKELAMDCYRTMIIEEAMDMFNTRINR